MSIRDEINQKLDSKMLATYEEVEKAFLERCEKISESFFKELHDELLQVADRAKNNLSKNTFDIVKYITLGFQYNPGVTWRCLPLLFNKGDIQDPKIIQDFCSYPKLERREEVEIEEKEVEKGFIFKHKKVVLKENFKENWYVKLPRSYILLINKLKEDAKKFDTNSEFILESSYLNSKIVNDETYEILLDPICKSGFDDHSLSLCFTLKYKI